MAMTKAEKAAMEALERKALVYRALRFTDLPDNTDIMPPQSDSSEVLTGYIINTERALSYNVGQGVVEGWTKSGAHGFGVYGPDSTKLSGGKSLHSTRLHALGALRRELEMRFAHKLAELDRLIAEELSKSEQP